MSEFSKIEWTDHTWNPWEGCQKVGPGCDHCYAETRNARFGGGQAPNWGPGAPRRRTGKDTWDKPAKWQKRAAEFMAQHGRRQRVFCASLADWLDNTVSVQWRLDMLRVIFQTPDLDWLMLSKRIGNLKPMLEGVIRLIEAQLGWNEDESGQPDEELRNWLADWVLLGKAPGNVWIGATVVNQEEADRDIPKLLDVPARVRFLSMEPLLGPVDLTRVSPHLFAAKANALTGVWKWDDGPKKKEATPLDWVIVGGESGPGARPMHPDWARSLRDQCASAGVPFLFKQWGEWTPGENVSRQSGTVATADWYAGEWGFGEENLASCDNHIDDEPDLYRVGKKAAGRLLDGIEHNGFPEVKP